MKKPILKNKTSGITLIALVVTIVVLIILATISIYAVLGENGLIKQAQKAKELHEQKQQEELEGLNNLSDYVGEYINGNGGGTTKPEDPTKDWDLNKVDKIDDGKGKPVPLPKGFYYVGGNIDTGIVISDKEGDTMEASGIDMGNQFVWIPVGSETDLQRTLFDSTGKPKNGLDPLFTEPYANGYQKEAEEYNTMKTQVLKYGGFYIGRYEAGVNSTTLRTGPTTAQTVVVKKGVAPYNYEPWGKAMNDASEIEGKSGAVYLAKNFAVQKKYTSVTSTLCYGSQWDAMCRYIGDNQRTTPTKSAPALTGTVSTDVSKNIYDLAGNCFEWTMEAAESNGRLRRGGCFSYDIPISYRNYNLPEIDINFLSFRCTLYIK